MKKSSNESRISISIFYASSEWHKLISNSITPFITKEYEEGSLENFDIYLSTNRGDHITVILQTFKNRPDLPKRFKNTLNQFLKVNKSTTAPIRFPLDSFFMNYPNNSVWNNIDLYLGNSTSSNGIQQINTSLSLALVHALGNDKIETNVIYTFLIYIQLGIIKAAYPSLNRACNISRDLLSYFDKLPQDDEFSEITSQISSYDEIKTAFEDNSDILVDIMGEIWGNSKYEGELQWLEKWEFDCRNYMQGANFKESFFLLSRLAYEHVGANNGVVLHSYSKLILTSIDRLAKKVAQNNRTIRIL